METVKPRPLLSPARMSSTSPQLINCPSCGTPNPTTAEVCTHCSGRIEALRPQSPTLIDIALLIAGFFLFAVGLASLVMAFYYHQSVESSMTTAGAASLVVGIVLILVGAYLRSA